MHYSNIIIPLLTFASTSSAAPTTDEGSLLHRRAFSSVEIPELANYKLIQKDGMEVYDLPEEGIELSAEVYKNLTGEDLPPLQKRQNPCGGDTYRTWDLADADWSRALSDAKVMSSPVCGPSSISNSFTQSYQWTVGGSLAPSAGITLGSLARTIGFSVDFSYSWGTLIATGYSATCSERHPCIATFRAWMGDVRGRARYRELTKGNNKLCGTGYAGNIELHLPITRDCNDERCGPDGVWDHCYYVGAPAKEMCPSLGPTPKNQCAANLYPGA